MKQTDKAALAERLNNIGMVAPTLAEGHPDMVRDIGAITGEILEAKRVGGEAIITIGQRLIEAKAMLSHGEWLPWLTEQVEYSERTAQKFMKIAREYSNPSAVADLGFRKALQLLSLPESEREAFAAENNVVDMTSRELEKAIKERDEARKAAEQAQADTKAADEARASMEQCLKAANELLDSAKLDLEQVRIRESVLLAQLKKLRDAPVEVAVMDVDQTRLDAARAEGEAAKAAEIAQLQAKLDKAKKAKEKADDKRRNAEASVNILKLQLGEAEKARARADAAADPDVAKFQVYFDQAQEVANKLRGLLIKARGREDQSTAEKLSQAMIALGNKIKEAAQ